MIIRKAEKSDILALAKVHVDSWRTTYKGIVNDNTLQNLSYDKREEEWKNFLNNEESNKFIYIAEDKAAGIVGFSIGGLERSNHPIYKGELWGIYILKEFQRNKIGSFLVKIIIENLLKLKINSMLVWVLKDNPSCAFYDFMGGNIIDQKPIDIRNEKFIEIAYGWDNLNELIKKLNKIPFFGFEKIS